MAALLRCVLLPCRLWYTLFSDNTSRSGIAAIMDRLVAYVRRYQNSSVRESREPSFVCQCHDNHNVIKRRSALFHWTDEHARRRLLFYVQLCCHLATRTRNRSERKNRRNVTMSLVNSEWKRHSAYVLRCQTPKTRRTACERWHWRRKSMHQAFWWRQTGFDTAHLLLSMCCAYCEVYCLSIIYINPWRRFAAC